MQSTGYIDWKGTGMKCWDKSSNPNAITPDLPASVTNFVLKDNAFSGTFEWDSKKFSMSGNVICYGMRLYDDPGSAGVGVNPNMILSSTLFDFDKKQLLYSMSNNYKFL